VLLLAGEPGMGKSRLLQEGMERSEAAGWTVVAGGCHRRNGQDPYAPLVAALANSLRRQAAAQQRLNLEGCAWLVRLLPELLESQVLAAPAWTLPPEQERRLMFSAVARYLANVAGPAGTLLVLDDLHWAGTDALDLLQALVRTPPERPLRILGAYRDTDISPQDPLAHLAADLAREGRAHRALLSPLSGEEATDLLVELLPEEAAGDSTLLQHLLERAGGVPLFLVSCIQALSTGQLTWNGSSHVPWTLREAILQRVVALPESAQQLLQLAAVVGRSVPRRLLLRVAAQADQTEEALLEALEACGRVRLLVETNEDTYQVTHDLIREVLLTDLGAARRAQLHRRVAEALEQGPGVPAIEVLAYHYARSSEMEKAVLYLERAGDAARARYAHAEAAEAYREVATKLDTLGRVVEAARVRENLGEVLGLLGRYDQALAVLEQAVEVYQSVKDLEGELRTLARIGTTHRWYGTPAEGLKRLQPKIDQLSALGAVRGAAAFYVSLARLYGGIDQYHEMVAAARQGANLARAFGDIQTMLVAQERLGTALSLVGELLESYQVLAEEVLPAAETSSDASTLINALADVSVVYAQWGDYTQEQHYIERAFQLAERLGDPRILLFLTHRLGIIAFARGEWKRARNLFEQAATGARERGRFTGDTYPLYGLGLLCLAEGNEEAASSYFEEARLAEQSSHHRVLHWMQAALAERDLLSGQPEAACARISPLLDLASRNTGYIREFLPLLAWAYLEMGEETRAQMLLTELIAETREARMRPALMEALRVQALAFSKEHRWEEAEQPLLEALTLSRELPAPYAEAKTLYLLGQVSLQRGEPELAREHFSNAQAILHELGERFYARRVEQSLEESARL
jgi:tetratricopeptide (TPR) repeat protein